jgi:hypothetical protein
MLLQGVVALDQGLKAKPTRRVAHRNALESPELAVDGLAGHRWFDAFDAEEVLLVQRA